MYLLINTQSWEDLKKIAAERFNMPDAKIVGIPSSFPCTAVIKPVTDVNGLSIHAIFFTLEDAIRLMEVKDQQDKFERDRYELLSE